MSRSRSFLPLAAVLALLSCSDRAPPPPPPETAALGGEIAARVGSDAIPVSLVARVAASQKIAPREALRHLVDDAVCANAARAKGLDRARPGAWLLTAAEARISADRLLAEARQGGPPTDAEIDNLTKRYWREVDRPVTVRVVHAVVRRPQTPNADEEKRARELAEQVRAAVASARDADDFQAKAKAVPRPTGINVVVESLPAFADDGYTAEGQESRMAQLFTDAAFTLARPGDTTGIVETEFGWHVIRLVERIPEQRMTLEARRIAFTEEVYMGRARVATEARLQALRAASPVVISPSAENLMRSLHTAPPPGPVE